MIFASDRVGGFGGMDLWAVLWLGEDWSEPINLGSKINTSGNEVFPFLGEDGTLYFSSDLLPGVGGLDLFRAASREEGWANPVNLGTPLNSPRDDFGIYTNGERDQGYFTSNRSGKDDDIYSFRRALGRRLSGTVVNCDDLSPIEGADVSLIANGMDDITVVSDEDGRFFFHAPMRKTIYAEASKFGYVTNDDCPGLDTISTATAGDTVEIAIVLPIRAGALAGKDSDNIRYITGTVRNGRYKNPVPNAKVTLVNRCTGEEYEVTTDENGNYKMPAEDPCDYVLKADKPNFLPKSVPFTTLGMDPDTPVEKDILLDLDDTKIPEPITADIVPEDGMIIELHHIYFDYDKDFIREDALPELRVLRKLLLKYPNMTGEIAAHTDARASHAYNEDLSARRAGSTRRWLVLNGIDADRMTFAGYGET
ncbi:MAG: OmpA family protein, partial [Bacteroidota bacterium]